MDCYEPKDLMHRYTTCPYVNMKRYELVMTHESDCTFCYVEDYLRDVKKLDLVNIQMKTVCFDDFWRYLNGK